MWALKKSYLGLQKSAMSLSHNPTGFYSWKLWELVFLTLKPWAGVLVWGWDQPISCLYPSYQSPTSGFFFKSLIVLFS